MEAEFMSDALDDFAADEQDQFARTRAAYAELLQADAAFETCSPVMFHVTFRSVTYAVLKVREAIADDLHTGAYSDRPLILRLGECTVRRLAAQLTGMRS